MTDYANIKQKQIKKFLKWLENNKGVEVDEGGNHTTITIIHNGKKILAPARHSFVNKHLVKDMIKKLVAYEVCTKEECDEYLK